jgi:oligopeptide transport system permease protein
VLWLTMARIVRGQVLSLRHKEFVDAAVTVGTRPWGILTRHLIPNTLGVVVVYTTLTVRSATRTGGTDPTPASPGPSAPWHRR